MVNQVDVIKAPETVFTSATIEVLVELITRTGCTIRIPVNDSYIPVSNSEGVLHYLDEVFQPRGVSVHMAMRWNRFGTLVNEARKRYGMPPHSSFDDALVLEPADVPPTLERA